MDVEAFHESFQTIFPTDKWKKPNPFYALRIRLKVNA